MGVFEKAIISGEDVLKYIPQRPPMVMVDSYYGHKDDSSFTSLTIPEDSLFCQDGIFQESGVIEHIAQSAAVGAGVKFIEASQEVPIGFIGAVSKFYLYRFPLVGETIYTTTKLVQKFLDVSLVSSECKINDEVIATGELKIFLQTKDTNIQ